MGTIRMRNLRFSKSLFENYLTGTVLDRLLCSYSGLPQGVNYMIVGDPGVGKTTIILDMMSNIQKHYPQLHILFVSAEMNEIDLAIYVQRFPKFTGGRKDGEYADGCEWGIACPQTESDADAQ